MDRAIRNNATDSTRLTACGESMAVVRKKALLRILARHDAACAGIIITPAEITATSEWFRRDFGLEADEDFLHWMEDQRLTDATFANAMHDFALVRLLEEHYAGQIDDLVSNQISISTARLRLET